MARLKALAARLQTLRPQRLREPATRAERDQQRDQQAYRRWYHLKRWKVLRWAVLTADGFQCRRCGRIEPDHSKLVADHIEPHRGDEAMFWNLANLQTLCAPCHASAKQREEVRAPWQR